MESDSSARLNFKVSKYYPIAGGSMASKYIINVRDFSPHKIIARGSLAGKYIINTQVFNPHKIIAGVSLAGKSIINIRVFIHHKIIVQCNWKIAECCDKHK